MRGCARRRSLTIWPLVVALVPLACSRPAASHNDKPTLSDHPAPFQNGEAVENSHLEGLPGQQAPATSPESTPPFSDSQGLPAGTLLTVRLRSPVSAGNMSTSATFDAVVDEPVLIEGGTMLPRGARVEGRVESAAASQVKRDQGYVRLTLNSIDVAGQPRPIQTASLFVRGNAAENHATEGEDSPQIIRLAGGRRLTFRLTEKVAIAGQTTVPAR